MIACVVVEGGAFLFSHFDKCKASCGALSLSLYLILVFYCSKSVPTNVSIILPTNQTSK